MCRHPGNPDSAVSCTEQSDVHPTLNVAACLQVGLIEFCREVAGYAFKNGICLHAKDAIYKNDKGGEGMTFL